MDEQAEEMERFPQIKHKFHCQVFGVFVAEIKFYSLNRMELKEFPPRKRREMISLLQP
jgi:hypothetical protein